MRRISLYKSFCKYLTIFIREFYLYKEFEQKKFNSYLRYLIDDKFNSRYILDFLL